MKLLSASMLALSLLLAGMVFMPTAAGAADWIGWQSTGHPSWVSDIAQEMSKKDYRSVFLNDPRTPQTEVLRLLNRAAAAYDAGNPAIAEEFIQQAIGVLQNGVARQYYTESDIEPLIAYIRQHTPKRV